MQKLKGQNELFEKLYKQNYKGLWNLFYRKGYDSVDCDDMAQETFCEAYRSFNRLDEPKNFKPLLITIAKTTIAKRFRLQQTKKRKGQVLPFFEDEVKPDHETHQLDDMIQQEQRRELMKHVANLPNKMRQALLFRIDQELSYEEIAKLTNSSIGTVKSQVHQARIKLKAFLQREKRQAENRRGF